jgi:hypothetical protein
MKKPYGIFPIAGFESLRDSWSKIRAAGTTLFGLLVYQPSDHNFPEYIAGDGLIALHSHAGRRCVLFVIHSPTPDYIKYAREKSNLWAEVFDQAGIPPTIRAIPRVADEPILMIDGERRSVRQLLTPSINNFLLADEILDVLKYFECAPCEHPCLLFFTDLNAADFWFADLRQWTGWRLDALEAAFRNYFQGPEFSKLVPEH